jgi:mono/diheme cytochrome c family protein
MKLLNYALLGAFVLSVGGNFSLRHDPARPNVDFLPEMVYPVAYDSFAPNPNFPDGKTLQAPVEGTVARPEPPRPKALDGAAMLARGARVYQGFCAVCHGGAGRGDGPVVARGYPAPPSLLGETSIRMTDERMFELITAGERNMPPYAAQLSPEDRRKAILYVRSMQKGAAK